MPLHNYQERGVEFIHQKKAVYLAVDLGLGKTLITLEALKTLPGPTVIFAPLKVIYNTWPQEIAKWGYDYEYTILHGPLKNELMRTRRHDGIYLINYEGIKWFFKAIAEYGFPRFNIILDEGSMVKSPSTIRFKLLKKLMPFFTDYRVILSATPMPKCYTDLWSQYYLLNNGKTLGEVFYRFRHTYFHYIGPPLYKTTIKKGADKAIAEMIRPVTFRLDQGDYLELPEKIDNNIMIEMTPELAAQYKELEKNFILEIEEQEVAVFNAAALSMKLRQFIQGAMYTEEKDVVQVHSLKLDALSELIEGLAGQPILCPLQFKFEVAAIKKRFGNVPIIAGGTSNHDAARYISMWNRGEIPLLVCHPASMSHGVNLQAGGHNLCWLGLPWNAEHYKQLNGRLDRQGQNHAVVVNHIMMKNTVDETVFKVLSQRLGTQQSLLNALKQDIKARR